MKYSLLAGLIAALIAATRLISKTNKHYKPQLAGKGVLYSNNMLFWGVCAAKVLGPLNLQRSWTSWSLCAGSHRLTDVAGEFGMSALALDATHLHINYIQCSRFLSLLEDIWGHIKRYELKHWSWGYTQRLSGIGYVYRGSAHRNESIPVYDVTSQCQRWRYSRHHDLLTAIGIVLCAASSKEAHQRWLHVDGAPCASWVWVSQGSTRRCRIRPRGNKSLKNVRRMNKLVRRLCFL